ncbi:MAG: hypothetical protein A2289_08830 [Deltaproteobacteria bacterium RIFOXYA12_FULL_58_15]|nr:MAG: hypothetical protein A2289_08830 [Deltaproteobacteria bacterium RIFOXYA12_FULL_58_15]OGR10562.1 MAG: hypothetical protein A2341_09755 [Deltaproteobacteria bacterium RIFOXYB12_FULL_58_9]
MAHRRLDALKPQGPTDLRETLPSEQALSLLSLNYGEVVADYYWLRTINEFGDSRKHHARYPNLIALTQRVLGLDPKFLTGYSFAGTALTVQDLDPTVSVQLLERGIRERPDSWQIPYLLGFNAYYFLGDYDRAAQAMALAATLDGAPPITGQLATRLAAQAGRPEIGIQMIDSILETIADENLREEYQRRRNILSIELHLSWLQEAIDRYRQTKGECPTTLGELIDIGLMHDIPFEPLGGSYTVDNCRAQTTSTYEKLRVFGGKAMP